MIVLTVLLTIAVFLLLVSIVFSDELKATKDRDPAAKNVVEILLLYPGLHAMIFYRISNWLWRKGVPFFPRAISQLARFLTGVEIHPGAAIGKGLFIDHGMGVVIGETAIIGSNVTLFQGVTLGGTGKETGKRHPTLGDNVVVGTGAKVLGNITIGSNSYVGANAVVLKSVPPNATVVGVPGHITKQDGQRLDTMMDHVHASDPVMQNMTDLLRRIKTLEDHSRKRPSPEGRE
ncbi:MAG: serine O-acetyltransferase EpsC [Candidatus Omnitrophota bacterium]|nr:serine O-acetyltransferase EpsC [Candidatus Omnitrophota bacterium]MDZ4241547.1 serine O-acetyltransferase EpsC [Candidatus Omnitrophota bacterium]